MAKEAASQSIRSSCHPDDKDPLQESLTRGLPKQLVQQVWSAPSRGQPYQQVPPAGTASTGDIWAMGTPLPTVHPPTIETALSPEVQCFVGKQISTKALFTVFIFIRMCSSLILSSKPLLVEGGEIVTKKAKTVYKER